MKVDFETITELVRQVADWVHEGGQQQVIPLGVRVAEDGAESEAELLYNEKNIGLLVFALVNDEVLRNACFVSMVKILADSPKEERDELVKMLARFGDDVDCISSQGGEREVSASDRLFYVRPGGIRS